MGEEKLCDECKIGIGMHKASRKNENGVWIDSCHCCRCHIAAGGVPADWHSECMKAIKDFDGKNVLQKNRVI
jgi:hypothetical protein